MSKQIVHCVEITPGSYLVSPQFMAEIERQSQKTNFVGSIFGVEIKDSDFLPFEVEEKNDE